MLNGINGQSSSQLATPLPEPVEAKGTNAPMDVIGTWESTRNDTPIRVAFQDDGKFVWTAGAGKDLRSISGKYSMNDGILVMEDEQGGTMVARVTAAAPGTFQFEMVGAPAEDPGIVFQNR